MFFLGKVSARLALLRPHLVKIHQQAALQTALQTLWASRLHTGDGRTAGDTYSIPSMLCHVMDTFQLISCG